MIYAILYIAIYKMKLNILIIIAHPDDEAIGMGGTISKHASRVIIFCITNDRWSK